MAAFTLTPDVTAEQARTLASNLHRSGYHCSEAVLAAVNALAGMPMPHGVVRLATGIGAIHDHDFVKGAMSGAVMALGLLGGRDSAYGPWEGMREAIVELKEKFEGREGVLTCRHACEACGMEVTDESAEVVGEAAAWVIEQAHKHGWL